jgi:hypothetical protein
MPFVLSVGPADLRLLDTTYLVSPGQRMTTQYPAQRIANPGDDLEIAAFC